MNFKFQLTLILCNHVSVAVASAERQETVVSDTDSLSEQPLMIALPSGQTGSVC
jgi:hypothetical protein